MSNRKGWDWMEITPQEKKAIAEARMKYYDQYPAAFPQYWKNDPSYDWAEKRKIQRERKT